MARAARAWEAWVSAAGESSRRDVRRGAADVWESEVLADWSNGGTSRRTMRSFICGTVDVPTATSELFVGHSASAEGVKATQALE